ncbi:MAG: thiamine phosphate synthase [Myxococcales bacterium]|nr:thiamine phosphate synthase [Myxococcales bacterium]
MVPPALPRLYAILDDETIARLPDWQNRLHGVLAARRGSMWLQLRCKHAGDAALRRYATALVALCEPHGVPVLINDRLDIAWEVGAAGVHLTETSIEVRDARRIAGEMIIAASRHNAVAARQAAHDGASLVVLGPIYDTASKRSFGPPLGVDAIAAVAATWPASAALIAIGGICTERQIAAIRNAGAHGVAAISAIWSNDGEAFVSAATA